MAELPDEMTDAEVEAFWSGADGEAIARILGEEAVWAEPSPELEDRVARSVAAAAAEEAASTPGAPVAPPRPPVDLAAASSRRRLPPALPWLAIAAAVLVVLGLAVPRLAGGGPAPDFTAALAGSELAPRAAAEAKLFERPNGLELRLDVTGLPPAPAGSYYQAWVKGTRGLVAVGTFHTGGKIVLWAGVDPKDYPTITVTLEPEDGDQASSGKRVLGGTITPS